MSVISLVGCLINQHNPRRRDVQWDGRAYIGTCRHCNEPIQRHGRHNWRKRKDLTEQSNAPTST